MNVPRSSRKNYTIREVVARFDDPDLFEDAVEALEEAGVDRADISMLGSRKTVEEKLGHRFLRTAELEDDSAIPQTIFASRHEVAEGKAAAMGLPAYIGGAGAGMAVVASGGTLAIAAMVAAAGAAIGAGFGALIADAIGHRHAALIEEQLSAGGLLLWVKVKDDDQEQKVISVLMDAGGKDVHAHDITRSWSEEDVPLHDFNPDPWLERHG